MKMKISRKHIDKVVKAHEWMVTVAATAAVERAKLEALAGICEPMRLYYRSTLLHPGEGELLLIREPFDHIAPVGFTATNRFLQPNVPYDRYWQWIRDNSRDLPLL